MGWEVNMNTFFMDMNMKAETKWLPSDRQLVFFNKDILIYISMMFVSKGPINNKLA